MDVCMAIDQDRLIELRQRIVDVLLEIDKINLQVNPHILANYAKSIGYLENDLYKWQLKARRSKRKFALVQGAVNKGENISLENVDATLDSEFAEWEAKLTVLQNEQLQLLEMLAGSHELSPKRARELKALHKKVIKRLHPDLRSNLPEDAYRFFLMAQSAYENGDLSMLQTVDAATEDYEEAEATLGFSEGDLEIEIAMAEAQLNVATERLDALKKNRPYTLAELLDDPTALAKRRTELETEIERQKEVVVIYEKKVADLKDREMQ